MKEEEKDRSAIGIVLRDPALVFAVALSVSLFFSMLLVPFLGVVSGIFTPLPLIYTYCRRGRAVGLAAIGASSALVGLIFLLSSSLAAVVLFLEYGLMAAVMSECLAARLRPEKVLGYAVAVVMAGGFLVLVVLSLSQGENPWTYGQRLVQRQVASSVTMYETMLTGQPPAGGPDRTSPEQAPASGGAAAPTGRAADVAWWTALFTRLFPGLSVFGTLLMAWINFMGLRALAARRGILPPEAADLKTWQPPDRLIWAVIAAGFALVLPLDFLNDVGLNVLIVLGLIYFFAGLSVVAYWFDRKAVPRYFRYLTYAFIALQQYLALVVIGVGLFDLWFDFRRIKKASAPGQGPGPRLDSKGEQP